jgi:UDP-GlcNAc:undecaprenyl-phosphate GlcNAc-1-phosphate transferase
MGYNIYLYIFLTAMFASLVMVPFLHRWAVEQGVVDQPSERKLHREAIPRLGGIAIFLSLFITTLVFLEMSRSVWGILAGLSLIFIIGLIDDLRSMPPKVKLLGQAGATLISMFIGRFYLADLGDLFGFGPIVLPIWIAVPFTVFAVVGVINAINLIDGLDGLAGGVAVIALSSFFSIAYMDSNRFVMALCAATLGSIFGFLKYNFYPARIFMGDAGSMTVGYLLAFISIFLTQSPGTQVSPVVPLLILGLPIVDTIWVMVHRVCKGRSPFVADLTHVHHKFMNLGLKHRFTVLIIYGISFFWSVFAITFRQVPEYKLLAIYLAVSIFMYFALLYASRHRERFWLLLRFDSSRGFRNSKPYRSLTGWTAKAVPLLILPICGYLLLAIWVAGAANSQHWRIFGILFLSAATLHYFTRDARNHFMLGMLYLSTLMVVFVTETNASIEFILEGKVMSLSNILFLLVALIVVGKMFFSKIDDFSVSTVEVLFFAVSMLLVLFYQSLNFATDPTLTTVKGVFFYLAIKILSVHGSLSRVVVGSMLTTLLVMTVRGYVG